MDVVYPDVASGAVHKETLHHNLPQPEQGGKEEEEEEGTVGKSRGGRGSQRQDEGKAEKGVVEACREWGQTGGGGGGERG